MQGETITESETFQMNAPRTPIGIDLLIEKLIEIFDELTPVDVNRANNILRVALAERMRDIEARIVCDRTFDRLDLAKKHEETLKTYDALFAATALFNEIICDQAGRDRLRMKLWQKIGQQTQSLTTGD